MPWIIDRPCLRAAKRKAAGALAAGIVMLAACGGGANVSSGSDALAGTAEGMEAATRATTTPVSLTQVGGRSPATPGSSEDSDVPDSPSTGGTGGDGAPAVDTRMVAGVCTHMAFGWSRSTVMSRMAELGTVSFRDEAYWGDYERSKGVYSVANLPAGIQDALAGRVDTSRSMLILGYGNDLYGGGGRPLTDANIAAFVNYAVNIIKDGGHRFGYIQIWNEWNHPNGPDKDRGAPAAYAKLFKAVSQAIRPLGNFKILTTGGVDWWDGWQFQKGIIDAGVLPFADGYGHHSYNWRNGLASTPAELFSRMAELQGMLTSANAGKPFPIYISEFGWPTWNASGFSEEQAGKWTAEFIARARQTDWIKGVWLYDLFDDGNDLSEPEHGFGVFSRHGAADKPRTPFIRNAFQAGS